MSSACPWLNYMFSFSTSLNQIKKEIAEKPLTIHIPGLFFKQFTPVVKGICCTNYVDYSHWTIDASNTHDATGVLKSDHMEPELTHCNVRCFSHLHKDVIKNVHGTHQRMDEEAGGGRKEEPSDQMSVSHWSATLAFSGSLLWPKKEDGGEEGGGLDVIENSGILADRMIGAAAFLLSWEADRRRWVQPIG